MYIYIYIYITTSVFMGNDQEHMKFPVKLSMGVCDTSVNSIKS